MIERPPQEPQTRGSISASPGRHTSDFELVLYIATLPGTWSCRVSARIGWSPVRKLCLDGTFSL